MSGQANQIAVRSYEGAVVIRYQAPIDLHFGNSRDTAWCWRTEGCEVPNGRCQVVAFEPPRCRA